MLRPRARVVATPEAFPDGAAARGKAIADAHPEAGCVVADGLAKLLVWADGAAIARGG